MTTASSLRSLRLNFTFRKGVTLSTVLPHGNACPVRSLRHLLNMFPTRPFKPFFHQGWLFTKQFLTEVLRDALKDLCYKGHHSGHSFR